MDFWNHNAHYHPIVLDAVPDGCGAALDIGCGEGLLTRKLARCARTVTGVDRSADMIRLARARGAGLDNVTYAEADFLDVADAPHEGFPAGAYDLVSSVAVVHHVDFAAALTAMTRLLAPGGRLVVIGLARDRTPLDRLTAAAGAVAHRVLARRHGGATEIEGMPLVWPPPMTWSEVRRASPPASSPAPASAATCCGGTRSSGRSRSVAAVPRDRSPSASRATLLRQIT